MLQFFYNEDIKEWLKWNVDFKWKAFNFKIIILRIKFKITTILKLLMIKISVFTDILVLNFTNILLYIWKY